MFSNIKKILRDKGLHRDSIRNVVPAIKGMLRGNTVTTWWYTKNVNFGDLLTPLIFKHYGFTPLRNPIGTANVLSVGSILQLAPESYSGHIIGSGLIWDEERHFPNAKVWAVRGDLTRERIGADESVTLGDPGLLAPLLYSNGHERKFDLGLVPHYIHKTDPRIASIAARYNGDVTVIDVQRHPLDVMKDVAQCAHILSSSLHGLVIADSFGIPNSWMHLSDLTGQEFKFHDYYTAIRVKRRPLRLTGEESLSSLLKSTTAPPDSVNEAREQLDCVFRAFRDECAAR